MIPHLEARRSNWVAWPTRGRVEVAPLVKRRPTGGRLRARLLGDVAHDCDETSSEPVLGMTARTLTCRGCGRQRPYSPSYTKTKSFDPSDDTILCKLCLAAATHVRLVCRRCGRDRLVTQADTRELKSTRADPRNWLCKTCTSRANARKARAVLLKSYGLERGASASERAEVFRTHMATFIDGKAHAAALELAHQARARGESEAGRRKRAIKSIIGIDWPGKFQLCPGCNTLIYLSVGRQKAGAHGFHGPCYLTFTHTETYRAWRARIGWTRSPAFAAKVARWPMPVPRRRGRGRPPCPEDVARHLRWLWRHVWAGRAGASSPRRPISAARRSRERSTGWSSCCRPAGRCCLPAGRRVADWTTCSPWIRCAGPSHPTGGLAF